MAATYSHPSVEGCLVSFPTPQILLLTLNRPERRNCIPLATSTEIQRLWEWFDTEPNLQVAIITGTGESFCSGADLKGRTPSSLEKKPPESYELTTHRMESA